MQELEKILEEFGSYICDDLCYYREASADKKDDEMEEICAGCKAGEYLESIRKHMNDGWIPVEERLPDIGQRVIATIKHHAWISDYDSDWVPESEKSRHQEYTESCEAILGYGGSWKYRCKEDDYMEDRAYINPEKNIAVPVSEVIAWRPLPEVYHPEFKEKNADWREEMLRKFDRRD